VTTPAVSAQRLAAFVQRLRELGWIDGRNIAIEYRWAEGSDERTAEFVAEFVRRNVDVIVTGERRQLPPPSKPHPSSPLFSR
jgi:putative tryptophan/tyrosine transport system substrate-binding protein